MVVRLYVSPPRDLGLMRSILQITPSTNFGVSSPMDRSGDMQSLARVLMGLSHPVQLIGQCRESTIIKDWPTPPRLTRRWLAVVTADDAGTLAWRTTSLKKSLDGIGLRCSEEGGDPHSPQLVPGECSSSGPDMTEPWREVNSDYIRHGSEYCATLVLRRWPREVAPGWLGQALSGDLPVDVAIHVEPQDAQKVARFLKRQQSWQSHSTDAGDELGRKDAEKVRLDLIAHVDKPCKVAIVLTVRAPDRATLRTRVETLQHEIGLSLADVRLAKFEQDCGLEATLPTGKCNIIGAWRTLDCTSVASTWMFQPATVLHENGADIGTTHDGGMLVRLDPFDMSLESFGGIVVAKVGAGKSYFMKLLARRLQDVEVLIVEQRNPAEYTGVLGATTFNLADVEYGDRADVLRTFVSDLWNKAKSDPRPRLLILDELWSLLRDPALAALIEEIARIGRHHFLSLWICTQQCRELLDTGKAVIDNASIRIFLKQHDRDLDALCEAVGLPWPARKFLRGAARGQALLDVGGLLVPVDIQASPDEHRLISTDPREKFAKAVAA